MTATVKAPAGAFRARPMKLSILTAALQELTPRARRDADPDLAVEEWLEVAREIGGPNIELSAGLDPSEGGPPAAAPPRPGAHTPHPPPPLHPRRAAPPP